MSATTPTSDDVEEREVYECATCGDPRMPETSVAGSFCSTDCHQTHRRSKRASELLELVEHDHRFCYNCFAQLKEVHKPAGKSVVVGPSLHDPEGWGQASDVLIGFQRRTEEAEIGEKSLDVDDESPGDRPIVEDGVATGTICRCGATDHRDVEPAIRDEIAPARLATQLLAAIDLLGREDKHEIDVLGPAVRSSLESGDDPRTAIEGAVILE